MICIDEHILRMYFIPHFNLVKSLLWFTWIRHGSFSMRKSLSDSSWSLAGLIRSAWVTLQVALVEKNPYWLHLCLRYLYSHYAFILLHCGTLYSSHQNNHNNSNKPYHVYHLTPYCSSFEPFILLKFYRVSTKVLPTRVTDFK